ncbi:MAG: class I SAM-dependent RNA methyltransferase [Lachnospiraceae bacterium]|nr:class I SAM-dependent RNA methyltransferase [Lachnospiraceae bacterium]MDY2956520.1 class I SAM-dependent RNA methyltransferase [Lachnospiraceae bacterium]
MNNLYELVCPCHFGLEAVLKREIYDLGYDITRVDNGRVYFEGDDEAVARANINLRTAERVMICVGEFKAVTFTELFDRIAELEWERFIPKDGKFWVTKASSVNSKLFSTSDIQSIVKKAVVTRLGKKYGISYFEETGSEYPIKINILKDTVSVCIDTTGVALHKRGYRVASGDAPISETLAASIIKLTPWRGDRILIDPFVGSGTIIIEAAMMAANIAPGMHRSFTSRTWSNLISQSIWNDVLEEANDAIDTNVETHLQGYDIDAKVLKIARDNAARAGVSDLVHFQNRDVSELSHAKKYGFIITNPPYGERLEEKEALPKLYGELGSAFGKLEDWSAYVITPYEEIERDFNRKATKKRKLYNGMIKTYLYSFEGKKPPKRKQS